jgi:hypothetical protein
MIRSPARPSDRPAPLVAPDVEASVMTSGRYQGCRGQRQLPNVVGGRPDGIAPRGSTNIGRARATNRATRRSRNAQDALLARSAGTAAARSPETAASGVLFPIPPLAGVSRRRPVSPADDGNRVCVIDVVNSGKRIYGATREPLTRCVAGWTNRGSRPDCKRACPWRWRPTTCATSSAPLPARRRRTSSGASA